MKPWAPLFSINRSDAPEVAVEGVLSVIALDRDKHLKQLVGVGDISQTFWSRSLLKPWQLCAHLPVLVSAYPELEERHFALFSASHRGHFEHLCLLRQIMRLGMVEESLLKCPPALPHSSELKNRLSADGVSPRSIFHNCSGKHFGYLLALKALGLPQESYLEPRGEQFKTLVALLSKVTGRASQSFVPTTDGCQLPNYALSANEMAKMYLQLLNADPVGQAPIEGEQFQKKFGNLGDLIMRYPGIVGGDTSLDTKVMLGKFTDRQTDLRLLSKIGADGLLALAVRGVEEYPDGIGIFIKIAPGGIESHLEKILREIFKQLKIGRIEEKRESSHIRSTFNFEIKSGVR
jgi:L-asparaginase II